MKFVLTPLHSIGPFVLGERRQDVRAIANGIGLPLKAEHGASDYFGPENAVQVEYDDAGCAWFIGANTTPEYSLLFHEMNLFDTSSDLVFKHLCLSEGGPSPKFLDGGYLFPKQIVSLWNADDQYDYVRKGNGQPLRPIWGQISIGNIAYLSALA